ncbi:carboxypeptidase-like regulatory domain-containing protein [Gelidibacter japonicus]|uniref:carboxypeptidase-like regulatory domain-containing protein n=1 Tax=Gelidibacter japonicus TaxID=1962232 RepID=UPI0020218B32|nr:carboxypeptidase-like regulatory domain-containing protein [Gelidibacter japonicus]MCL8009547.1 carboxypeptidase-like regulatory domain-containing protein [Gelidibacter japonicus]
MHIKFLAFIGISLLLSSCDCQIIVNGKVISSETGKPISGAKIEMVDRNLNSATDQNGNFRIGEMTGFCYSPKIKVTFENHKPFEIELDSDSQSQNYKVKKESESVDFDEPFYPDPNNKNTFIISTWIEKYSGNFEIKSDSLIIYLDEKNRAKEMESIKRNLENKNSG